MPGVPGPLTHVARDLWTVDMPHSVFGFQVGTRMTVIRLESGRILLYSPVTIPDQLRFEIGQLGEVCAIICPNTHHHLYVREAIRAFPTAKVYGPAELAPKRRDLHFDGYLTNVPPPSWGDDVLPGRVRGSSLHETALFHVPSQSLIVADLFQNIRTAPDLWMRFYLWVGGTLDHPGPHRMVRWSFTDKEEGRKGIRRILKWNFSRIVPCHGAILERHAKEVFTRAYAWLEIA